MCWYAFTKPSMKWLNELLHDNLKHKYISSIQIILGYQQHFGDVQKITWNIHCNSTHCSSQPDYSIDHYASLPLWKRQEKMFSNFLPWHMLHSTKLGLYVLWLSHQDLHNGKCWIQINSSVLNEIRWMWM